MRATRRRVWAGAWLALAFTVWVAWVIVFVGESDPLTFVIASAWPAVFAVPGVWSLVAVVRRRVWGALAPLAASGALLVGPIGAVSWGRPGEPLESDVRVLTYNIEHGVHGWDKVAEVIRAADPDILCLQEVAIAWPERPDDPLLRYLEDFHWFRMRTSGLLIASRFPLTGQAILPVQKTKDDYLLIAHTEVDGRRITVMNTHLLPFCGGHYNQADVLNWPKNFSEAARDRRMQLRLVLDEVASRDGPVILCGDLNRNPTGPEYGWMTRELTDSYAAAGRGFGYTSNSFALGQRIDYVLSRGFETVQAGPAPGQASDHKPYSAVLRLRDASGAAQ